jgi:hypothetical protein
MLRRRFPRTAGDLRNKTDINDPRLARIVKPWRDLPGYELFQYIDDAGERHTVSSTEVNAYLREITGEEITAKDFRTWAGTNLAALALREFEYVDSDAMRKRAVVRTVERVAKHLGNTPAVCRRCYIHPEVFEGFLDGTLLATLAAKTRNYLADEIGGRALRKPRSLLSAIGLVSSLSRPRSTNRADVEVVRGTMQIHIAFEKGLHPTMTTSTARHAIRSETATFDPKTGELRVVIETPKCSRNKYDYDPDCDCLDLATVLPEGMSVFLRFWVCPVR